MVYEDQLIEKIENQLIEIGDLSWMLVDSHQLCHLWNLLDHELGLRKCYKCKSPLLFNHFFRKCRQQNLTIRDSIKIWKSEHVQIYCCNCFYILEACKNEVPP